MLGCFEDGTAVIRKKGRIVRIVSWQDASVTCEDCGAVCPIELPGDRGVQWDGIVRSTVPKP